MIALYHNGYPQNLEAAALDALSWLKFYQQELRKAQRGDGSVIFNVSPHLLADAITRLQAYVAEGNLVHIEDGADVEMVGNE